MPEQIKPCPLCGNQFPVAHSYRNHDLRTNNSELVWRVECGRCGCNTSLGTPRTKSEALVAWDRRVIPADQVLVPRELLERVIESLAAEVESRYGDTKDHPALAAKYERDTSEVRELRVILQQ